MPSNRRSFLKFMGVAAAAAVAPATVVAKPEPIFELPPLADDGLIVDWKTKTIHYQARDGHRIKVNDLYKRLVDFFDDPERLDYEQPMMAVTPHMFEMRGEWHISGESMPYLTRGSITQGDEVYVCCAVLGNLNVPNTVARIEAENITQFASPVPDNEQWFDELLKVPRGTDRVTFQDHKQLGRPWTAQMHPTHPGVVAIPNPLYNLSEVPTRKLVRAYGSEWRMWGTQPPVENMLRRELRQRWQAGKGWS